MSESGVEHSEPRAPRFIMVTGASSGIGRATAARLADTGQVRRAVTRQGRPEVTP
jgi:NADP-dependent 3-hydroxy acid dehydrogenase YdfG